MKLLDQLYKIKNLSRDDGRLEFTIGLISESVIYQAHFPGMPITPGVCIIQIAKELLEYAFNTTERRITKIKNAKFLSVLEPKGQDIIVSITNIKQEKSNISAQFLIFDDKVTYAKLSLQTTLA